MINNLNNTEEIGLMTKKEFYAALGSIKTTDAVKKACYLILVSGYYNTVACLKEKVSRPTVSKYIKLIKTQWRKNIANK